MIVAVLPVQIVASLTANAFDGVASIVSVKAIALLSQASELLRTYKLPLYEPAVVVGKLIDRLEPVKLV